MNLYLKNSLQCSILNLETYLRPTGWLQWKDGFSKFGCRYMGNQSQNYRCWFQRKISSIYILYIYYITYTLHPGYMPLFLVIGAFSLRCETETSVVKCQIQSLLDRTREGYLDMLRCLKRVLDARLSQILWGRWLVQRYLDTRTVLKRLAIIRSNSWLVFVLKGSLIWLAELHWSQIWKHVL